jgi:ABC-type Fe3+/spermidine/putrescine transport system ATPase subunit
VSSGALEVSALTVAAGDGPPILREVDLTVPAGRLVALVGPSGAGKTTLLRAIAGLDPHSSGRIALSGGDLTGVPAHRRGVAMVFQEPRLLPHLSVLDNAAFPLRAAGVRRTERREVAAARLSEVGLGGFADRGIDGLSGGEQQRVSLARALTADPRLLLLDEPLTALDPERRESLRRLIASVQRDRELTTLLVTHDRFEAAELGDEIALMLEGRIVQQDEPRALFERPATRAAARFFGIRNLLRLPDQATDAVAAIRPEHVVIGTGPYRAIVTAATYRGSQVRLTLEWDSQTVDALVDPAGSPSAGAKVEFDLPADRLWVMPDAEEASRASGTPTEGAERR